MAKTKGPRHRIAPYYNGFGLWGFEINCGSYFVFSPNSAYKTKSAAIRAARAWAKRWLRSEEVNDGSR